MYKVEKICDGQMYAAKILNSPFNSPYTARQTYREIKIMRKLSKIDHNNFTPKLIDIILPN